MCNIIKNRIRINRILMHTLKARLDNTPATLEELTQACVAALQLYYDVACPEECVEAKARTFVVWHLARAGRESRGPSSAIEPRRDPGLYF